MIRPMSTSQRQRRSKTKKLWDEKRPITNRVPPWQRRLLEHADVALFEPDVSSWGGDNQESASHKASRH